MNNNPVKLSILKGSYLIKQANNGAEDDAKVNRGGDP